MLLWLQTYFSEGGFWIFMGFVSAMVIGTAIWLRQPD
jgi:hypothetical protein